MFGRTTFRRLRPTRLAGRLAALAAAHWLLASVSRAFVAPPRGALARAPTEQRGVQAEGLAAAVGAPLALAGAGSWLALGGGAAHAAEAIDAPTLDATNAVVQAFLLTFVSEIGDKTFFIAAILAAGGSQAGQGQNQKLLTFAGAIAALAVMTLLAVGIGQIFHAVPDVAGGLPLDDYASILAFGFFGVKLLTDAVQMEDDGSLLDEKEEAEEAVRDSLPAWISGGTVALVLPPLVLQAFVLVFAAEIGDRSFISAAALSAQGGPEGAASVFLGGISAHSVATLAAVLLGDLISNYVSEKQLAFIGGGLFLVFAGSSAAKVFGAGLL